MKNTERIKSNSENRLHTYPWETEYTLFYRNNNKNKIKKTP